MDTTDPSLVSKNSTKARLLIETDLLILDEVTMMEKYDLERIDRLLRELMENNILYTRSVPLTGTLVQTVDRICRAMLLDYCCLNLELPRQSGTS